MKFLGISIYATALLAYVQALPGGGHHREHDWERHDKWEHKEPIYPPAEVTTQPPETPGPIPLPRPLDLSVIAGDIHTQEPEPAEPPVVFSALAEECPLTDDTLLGQEILHFNGIFYGNFRVLRGTGSSLGPLAVGGSFHAPDYLVNSEHDLDCSADPGSSFDSIALVVGGDSMTQDTQVRGDALLAGSGDPVQYQEQLAQCQIIKGSGTGIFDFAQSASDALAISQTLASTNTTHVLGPDGVVGRVPGSIDGAFKVFTFATCNCGIDSTKSDPVDILYGINSWGGPSGDVPSDVDTVVFNIPVITGGVLPIFSDTPTTGFNPCRTIYNFYPVDTDGNYDPTGEFTIDRNTTSQLGGLVIAPRAHILEGASGNFAGTVIGLDYAWNDPAGGPNLLDWGAAGCPAYEGCLPKPGDPVMPPGWVVPVSAISPVPLDGPPPSNTAEIPPESETVYVVPMEKYKHSKHNKSKKHKEGGRKNYHKDDEKAHKRKGNSWDDDEDCDDDDDDYERDDKW